MASIGTAGDSAATEREELPSSAGPTVRFAESHEISRWDDLIADNPDGGSSWRSRAFTDSMRLRGLEPVYLVVDGVACSAFEMRVRPWGKFWYMDGPGVADIGRLLRVVESLRAFAAKNGIFTIRIHPFMRESQADRQILEDQGYRRMLSLTTDHTIIVDIAGSEDEVLRRFSTRARRWIKRAARDGVTVEQVEATDANCRTNHELERATSDGRYTIMDRETSTATYQSLQDSGCGQLFFAYHEGVVVASAFAMRLGKSALYLSGASIRKKPGESDGNGLGAHGVGHAMQWEIMKWAREAGCVHYDLYGSPASQTINDQSHPLYGVGQFKLSFSKDIFDYIGCYDVPVRSFPSWMMYQTQRLTILFRSSRFVSRFMPAAAMRNPDLNWLT